MELLAFRLTWIHRYLRLNFSICPANQGESFSLYSTDFRKLLKMPDLGDVFKVCSFNCLA